MSKNFKKSYMIYGIVLFICIVLDQISKLYFQSILIDGHSITLIPSFLELTYVENRGAAFGMLQGGMLFFALCSIVVVSFLLYQVRTVVDRKYSIVLLAIVSGGAIGNMIDRVFHTYVIDFIHFSNLFGYSFPVFNVADIFLSCGLPLLFIDYIIRDNKLKSEEKTNGKL